MKVWQIIGRTHRFQPEGYVRFQFKTKEQAEEAMKRIKDEWQIREVEVPDVSAIFDPMPKEVQ